jgi:hypothetical protein
MLWLTSSITRTAYADICPNRNWTYQQVRSACTSNTRMSLYACTLLKHSRREAAHHSIVPVCTHMPQCCPPVTQPVTVVTGMQTVSVSSPAAEAVCPQFQDAMGNTNTWGVDAGMAVGNQRQRLCVYYTRAAGQRVSAANAGKFVLNITVVVDTGPWAQLKCPTGYTKFPTPFREASSTGNSSTSIAVCIRKAPAGTPVAQLVKSVLLDTTCKFAHGAYQLVPGDLSPQAARNEPAQICVAT